MPQMQIRVILQRQRLALARHLPGFVVRALERLLHQDEVNAFVAEHGHLDARAYMEESLLFLDASYRVFHASSKPSAQRAIYVSNHPSGGLDGVVLIHLLLSRHRELRVLANEQLKIITPIAPLLVGVNKLGSSQARQTVRELADVLAGDAPVLIFPAGEVAKLGLRGVREQSWNRQAVRWSRQYRRPIVPVHLSGRSSVGFHTASVIRRALGLGFHFEMLWLIDALYAQRGAQVRVHIGEVFEPTADVDDQTAVQALRRHVLQLPLSPKRSLAPLRIT